MAGARAPHVLLHLIHASGGQARRATRLCGRDASRLLLVGEHVHVALHFEIEVAFDPGASKQVPDDASHARDPHLRLLTGRLP